MGAQAEAFLSSFNRVEKCLKEALNNPANMGFSEMVRRLSRQKHGDFSRYEDDLLQMAQLRNAIVHERIAEDFVIAEPNTWAVERIATIERALTQPERVLPRFQKKVTGFEQSLPLKEILKIVATKRYSQFPIYNHGKFRGLITIRGLGVFFAVASLSEDLNIQDKTAADLLKANYKQINYRFVSAQTLIADVERLFAEEDRLEAVLITEKGNSDGNLLGIIRPKDLYNLADKDGKA